VAEWTGSPRGPGVYVLGPNFTTSASVYAADRYERRFTVVGGTLTVDLSTEYAMIGRVSARATEDGGTRELTLEGRFSAGCVGAPCRP
jgi:hypothetical protein